eukprot:2114138-Rhodomonas_salina.1
MDWTPDAQRQGQHCHDSTQQRVVLLLASTPQGEFFISFSKPRINTPMAIPKFALMPLWFQKQPSFDTFSPGRSFVLRVLNLKVEGT